MKVPDFIRKNVVLSGYSTLGVGGKADYFANIRRGKNESHESPEDYAREAGNIFYVPVCRAYDFAKENGLDIFVLGRGSNTMFSDSGFRGLVLRFGLSQLHFHPESNQLWADAGALISEIVSYGEGIGFSGFECFAGLPGTVGGAIYGNAGCYDAQFWDTVEKVMFFDGEYFRTLKKEPGIFGYRRSIFKDNPGWIIVAAHLKFEPEGGVEVIKKTKEIRKLRQKSQPKNRSVGCIFKNPLLNGERISAGRLIDQAGLKGITFGGAQISKTHGNFFINLGEAKAEDFIELIKIAKSKVFENSGILLQEEIIEVGDF